MHAHADMPRNPYLTVKTVILVGLLWICHDGQGRDASRSGRGAAHSALAAAGGPELPAIYCGSLQFGRVSQSFLAR